MTGTDHETANGQPTKSLFTDYLTKDLNLTRAVLDLVDNSVDGANRIRSDNFDGLEIDIHFDESEFVIEDNCGGIPLDDAEEYVFRFGKPSEVDFDDNSIGQFGIGMKRSIFKIGKQFHVDSISQEAYTSFSVSDSVDDWKEREEWDFIFDSSDEDLRDVEEGCTKVKVTNLHESISNKFCDNNFQNDLMKEIRKSHQEALRKGMVIRVNGDGVTYEPAHLLESETIQPAYRRDEFYPGENGEVVNMRIFAGVAESEPQDAGWYIYCNGRMLIGPDQTNTTGWGEDSGSEIPNFHNQYARFRGYTFFDSENPSLLPWNTTKTNIDMDSALYARARREMISVMEPIVEFMNEVKREKEVSDTPALESHIEAAESAEIYDLAEPQEFEVPEDVEYVQEESTISYSKPIEEIDDIKDELDVTTNKEVGIRTFEYFRKMEC